MLTPAGALHFYTVLRLHFSSPSYDGVKYNWKLRNEPDFTKRNDKTFFARLSRQPDPYGLMIANLSYNPKLWVGDLFVYDAESRYQRWKRYCESVTYSFAEELKTLDQQAFKVLDNSHPLALKKYMRNEISVATMTIANEFIKFVDQWNKDLADDPVWAELRLPIIRFKPFIKFDKKKIAQEIKKWLDN